MGQRPGVQITHTALSDGGEEPNRYNPEISIHIRAYWPPKATEQEITSALISGLVDAQVAIMKKLKDEE